MIAPFESRFLRGYYLILQKAKKFLLSNAVKRGVKRCETDLRLMRDLFSFSTGAEREKGGKKQRVFVRRG